MGFGVSIPSSSFAHQQDHNDDDDNQCERASTDPDVVRENWQGLHEYLLRLTR